MTPRLSRRSCCPRGRGGRPCATGTPNRTTPGRTRARMRWVRFLLGGHPMIRSEGAPSVRSSNAFGFDHNAHGMGMGVRQLTLKGVSWRCASPWSHWPFWPSPSDVAAKARPGRQAPPAPRVMRAAGNNAVTLITVPATRRRRLLRPPRRGPRSPRRSRSPASRSPARRSSRSASIDDFGKPVVGLGNTTKSATATVARLTQPRVLDRQARSRHRRQPEQVGELHRHHGADDDRPRRRRPGPSTDNTGTLVDNGDGTYKYTFYRDITTIKSQVAAMTVTAPNNNADLGDLTYDPTLTHRLTIALSGNAPGTGTNTPTGATSQRRRGADEAPGQRDLRLHPGDRRHGHRDRLPRDIVANANCESCHRKLGGIPGLSDRRRFGAGFHGGSRNDDPVLRRLPHRPAQLRPGRGDAHHRTARSARSQLRHATSSMAARSATCPTTSTRSTWARCSRTQNYNYAGVLLNETTYPQDIRNCTSCHDGSANVPRAREDQGRRQLEERTQPRWRAAPATTASTSRPAPA